MSEQTMRTCGGCTACCKLMPMASGRDNSDLITAMVALNVITAREAVTMIKDFYKPAGERCPHQRHGKGCNIYPTRPLGCRTWSCRWLTNKDTAKLSRPDRSHYVIDEAPDYCTDDAADGERIAIPVIQVWVDPDYPDAHEDPELRAYLARRAAEGYAALIRYNSMDAFALFAPAFTPDGTWRTKHSKTHEEEHTAADKVRVLGGLKIEMEISK